uniref:Uncharacterized protein n=1 Tax=Arundo donax TaxID=35708 RepID=A0A0A9HXM8_ARUDO
MMENEHFSYLLDQELFIVVFTCPHLARLKYYTILCPYQENLAQSCLIGAGLSTAGMQIPGQQLVAVVKNC